ncbi:MAG: NHLP family bacteriocin export ABC transporter peptidase/permease/ATPase subunit [Candidatus Eremiobacteraeota bacterium]|nr:NHLP family bacteriocin export ABC transporter peptidase/permease/ATPase subunit [Candidatus Eremiobacteraeota bacterium]
MNAEKKRSRRVKTPTVLQMEALECGAAALGIVLSFYGRNVPLEKLRIECGVTRNGSKALNIVKTAREYGLVTEALSLDIDELCGQEFPLIVFWNFNHFVVVEGFSREWFYINDPAFGPRKVSPQEFSDSFTGVVLTFKPGPDFRREGSRRTIIDSLNTRVGGSRKALFFALLAGLALVLPGMAVPLFTKIFIDGIFSGGVETMLFPLVTAMLIIAVLRGFLTWLQRFCLLRLETHLSVSESGKYLWRLLRLPVEFFEQRFAGDIVSRVSLNDRIAQLLSNQLSVTILNVFLALFYLVILFLYSARLTAICLFLTALNFVALKYVSDRRVHGNLRLLNDRGKLVGTSISGLRYIETLKASGTESDFFSRWAGIFTRVINGEQELNFLTSALSILPASLSSLGNVIILILGSLMVMNGKMTIGSLVAYQSLMALFVTPINNLVNLGASIQEIEGTISRIDDVFRYKVKGALPGRRESDEGEVPGKTNGDGAARAGKLEGTVELRDITFGYGPFDPPLLQGFSLSLSPGSRVAIIGPSGSGKSTVSKILCGLYAPWQGEVLFDGKPLAEVPAGILKSSLSQVDQTIMLFEGTIRENLTLWETAVEETDIVLAAKDASIHDDINERESGYESLVEEGGRNFSGGQRQRLEIARALVTNPRIIVLDEATSALDPLTELAIDGNLRRRGCTTVIIAHRLSTIRDCDEIVVLDGGKVAQRGTHESLIKEEGLYRNLIEM